ncbi:MAG TPA: hypothetical protein VF469_06240, partial [Kofleriaceae bacterium]
AAIATISAAGRFGDREVFTVAVHAALGGEGTISAVAFKSRLVAAMHAGQLDLARADLVAAMDPALVAASEVDLGRGVSYHVVVVLADAVLACR